jgi:hypothetical protein
MSPYFLADLAVRQAERSARGSEHEATEYFSRGAGKEAGNELYVPETCP